jgi:hypothetical protein
MISGGGSDTQRERSDPTDRCDLRSAACSAGFRYWIRWLDSDAETHQNLGCPALLSDGVAVSGGGVNAILTLHADIPAGVNTWPAVTSPCVRQFAGPFGFPWTL